MNDPKLDGASKISPAAAVKDAASKMTEDAAETLITGATSAARAKRNMAADYVASLSMATSAAAQSLGRDGCVESANRLTGVARMLGETSDSMASYDVRSLVDSAADVAKRNPALTFGLAALAGYAVVRMAKPEKTSYTKERN